MHSGERGKRAGCGVVALQLFVIGMLLCCAQELQAHGPGRPLRVEMGYCDPDSRELRNGFNVQAHIPAEPIPFCFRMRNLESFPVALRLRFLPGYITEEGKNVCVLNDIRQAARHDNFFWQGENKCQNPSLLLEPAASRDIPGQWVYRPGDGSRHKNNAMAMVGCVLGEAFPLVRDEPAHVAGVHLKGKRSMNMAFIQGAHGMQTAPLQDATTFQDHDPACDPITPLLADLAEKKAAPTVAAEHSQHVAALPMMMTHPGLTDAWLWAAGVMLVLLFVHGMMAPAVLDRTPLASGIPMTRLPLLGPWTRLLTRSPLPLAIAKGISILVFLLVIHAGLTGNTQADTNFATIFVWNFWWPLVIISVLFVGTGWCAICPWDALATALVTLRLVRRSSFEPGLQRTVPVFLRNVYPALLLFVGLAWLELGWDATTRPELTAYMALVLVLLSLISLLVWQRKAFCRYFCPVGRTIGFYSRLSPVAVRPVTQSTCDTCPSLACYHGTREYPPCPTHLTVGRFSQNTHCLSCTSCMLSCPERNVTWQVRSMTTEAAGVSRPTRDGAWFMLILLGTTLFHGFSMTSHWEEWLATMVTLTGERGDPTFSFALGMFLLIVLPVPLYALAVAGMTTRWTGGGMDTFKRAFAELAFATLPLAFVYHLAHNLTHLVREKNDWLPFLFTSSATASSHAVHHDMAGHAAAMSPSWGTIALSLTQISLVALGFHLCIQIARHRAMGGDSRWRRLPIMLFGILVSTTSLWLLSRDMVMRF
ncbi:MAG: hypothetical protein HQL77_06205 [Magnetococcales bacterium]|nr:hypothetical protein [Magnetococcales bacterium]